MKVVVVVVVVVVMMMMMMIMMMIDNDDDDDDDDDDEDDDALHGTSNRPLPPAAHITSCAPAASHTPPVVSLQAHALSAPPHEFAFDNVFTDTPSAVAHHCSVVGQVDIC